MANVITTAWVEPPLPIRGLDHLGSQAPCVALYTQLLPGITNVTDRARYYSFYPWLIREFERRYQDHSRDAFATVVRRAECLFTLAALRHEHTTGELPAMHGAGMVGRQTLATIAPDAEAIDIAARAAFEGGQRYFQNRLGALAQYYFGPLQGLHILAYPDGDRRQPPGYDRDRGTILADAFAAGVDGDAFFSLLDRGVVTWDELDGLESFCPCQLHAQDAEREALVDVFLARSEPYRTDDGSTRRASLALMLDLVQRGAAVDGYPFVSVFRASAYSGHLPDGSAWTPAPALANARQAWSTYHRNEILSVAVQGLFAAVLSAIVRDRRARIDSAAEAGDAAIDLVRAGLSETVLAQPLTAAVNDVAASLPALGAWLEEDHEIRLAEQVISLDTDAPESAAVDAVRALLALLARGIEEQPYDAFDIEPEYFAPGEIHLLSLRQRWENRWRTLTVEAWIRDLAVEWGIDRHLRVALRKLRGERRDTFRVRPLEGQFAVVEIPPPTFTTPRLRNALQMLRDLGLVEVDEYQHPSLTERGTSELEACRV